MIPKGQKIVLGITGASGSVYAQALVEALRAASAKQPLTLAVVLSSTAQQVWEHEVSGDLRAWLEARDVPVFSGRDYSAPFASGSAKWDSMVVAPCSMSTVAKVAHGISDDLLTRAADVILKERRRLILVARETPLSAIHLENMLAVTRAGALVLPATPSFYRRPTSVAEVVHSVIARILDHLDIEHETPRWGDGVIAEEDEEDEEAREGAES